MSAGTESPALRPPAVQGGAHGTGTAADPDAAGRLLRRLTILPVLLAMAWLLAGLPLLLAGWFTPWPMLAISLPLAVLLVACGLRYLPDRWPAGSLAVSPASGRTPWSAVAGLLAIAVVFGADQLIYHSQYIIVGQDPGSYAQFAAWISRHGSLPIPQDAAAFGWTHGVLYFGSPAFYQVGQTAASPRSSAVCAATPQQPSTDHSGWPACSRSCAVSRELAGDRCCWRPHPLNSPPTETR